MGARMIRDGLLDSERVQKRSVPARWLYVSILLVADDVGLFEVSHFKLHRAAALDEKVIPKLLAELAAADLIRLYESGGKRYGFVPRFGQRLRVKRTKHPLPPEQLMQDDLHAASKINDLVEKVRTDVGDAPHSADKVPQGADKRRPEVELEGEEEVKTDPSLRSGSAPPTAGGTPAKAPRKRAKKGDEPLPSVLAWNSYSTAYLRRYKVEPVRNARVNGQLASFVTRIPANEVAQVAAFFVNHNGNLYVNAKHPVDLLLRDAERLRTDWATNQSQDQRLKTTSRTSELERIHEGLSGGRTSGAAALAPPTPPLPQLAGPTMELLDARTAE